MKKIRGIMIFLHFFVGIGAVAGGLAAILEPESPLGISKSMLENSPFQNFFIPGILLFGVIGLGNILSGFIMISKLKIREYTSGVFGFGLVVWIIVQCIMLWAISPLHIIYFIIGAVQSCLAAFTLFYNNSFPFDIIKKLLGIDKSYN